MNLIQGFRDGLRPEPLLTVSAWADAHRMLTTEASAEPGRWRTDRTPYLREILDRLSSIDPTEEVVVMKGAQLGFTEAGFNFVGYVMDAAPGPMLYVMPTVDLCKRNSKTRLAPMIEGTPRLRERVAAPKSRDSGNTTLMKEFAGGVFVLGGANSASTLSNMPVRFLVLDEIDRFPLDLDGEGSPLDLAIKRTATFSRKKIYKLSTPTDDGTSVISREFEATDRRYYHVPCPECGAMQVLRFERLKWEQGKHSTAKYECEHCGHLIEERFKTKMLASGQWVAEAPENTSIRKAGYHINSLYSPYGWYSWADAAREYEESENNTPKRKVFVNTVLGKTFKEDGDSPPWRRLYDRRGGYSMGTIPSNVCMLTAGADVQADRIEFEVVGYCPGRTQYSIAYKVLMGDTTKPEVWGDLFKALNEQFPHDEGGSMGISLMAVDSGYNTTHVYDFCMRAGYSRAIPTKGQDNIGGVLVSPPKQVHTMRDGKKFDGLKVWHVNTHMIKSEIYGFLKMEAGTDGSVPDGYCYFPEYSEHYFRSLTAESLRLIKDKKGYLKYEWHKDYERNEALDCRVYARAAANVLGMDLFTPEHWQAMKGRRHAVQAPPQQKKRQGGYW